MIQDKILGKGKAAKFLSQWLNVELTDFGRNSPPILLEQVPATPTRWWVLISDDALQIRIVELHRELKRHGVEGRDLILHASAANSIPHAKTAHFPRSLGAQKLDREVSPHCVVINEEWKNIEEARKWLPFSSQSIRSIPEAERALYHALCVLIGNFSQFLWMDAFEVGQSKLGVGPDFWSELILSSYANIRASGRQGITGPLVRGDVNTTATHERVLAGFPRLLERYREELKKQRSGQP